MRRVILAVAAVVSYCAASTAQSRGDIDGDGTVSMADANMIVNAYLGTASDVSMAVADIDGDGRITMADANAIVNAYLSGMPIYTPKYDGQSAYIAAVDEYVPAPGQFVNELPEYEEGDDEAAMVRKCTECLANNNREMVSLGSFGGYITFHFDHSVRNVAGERDIYIMGNAFLATAGGGASSEPGIVMVSQDLNGNGLPDDEWYELSGSCDEDSVGKVQYGYEITYTYSPLNPTPWVDNQGNAGTVERNNVHRQEYFPLWLVGGEAAEPKTLTFRGTRLPNNGVDASGTGALWKLDAMRYGYVDNLPNTDTEGCSFDISWAVEPVSRQLVHLECVDFIRVYSAMNQMCGWLGETSTEILGATDLHFQQ